MNDIRIRKLKVENFRGYSNESIFDFTVNDNTAKVILLSGANGYGKTSLIDAIEWCLTGNVDRVLTEFKGRTEAKERRTLLANKGLLRNINRVKDDINVSLELDYKGNIVVCKRVFNGEYDFEALGMSEKPIITCTDAVVQDEVYKMFLNNLETFNDNNICSLEKNLKMYSKGRKNIYELFQDLFVEYKEASNVEKNLKLIAVNIKERLEENDTKISSINESIENLNESVIETIDEEKKSLLMNEYPEIKFLEDELNPFEIIKSDSDDIISLLRTNYEKIQSCEYSYLLSELVKSKKIYEVKNRIVELENLNVVLKNNYKDYISFKDCDFVQAKTNMDKEIAEKSELESLEDKSHELVYQKYISWLNDNKDAVSDNKLENKLVAAYKIEKEEFELISTSMSKFNTDNEVMEMMKYLVDNSSSFENYRELNDDCPVCGSLDFKKSTICYTAKNYLGSADLERGKLVKRSKLIVKKMTDIATEMKNEIISKLTKDISANEISINAQTTINDIKDKCKTLKVSSENLNLDTIDLLVDKIIDKDEQSEIIKRIILLDDSSIMVTLKNYESFMKLDIKTKITKLETIEDTLKLGLESADLTVELDNLTTSLLDTKKKIYESLLSKLEGSNRNIKLEKYNKQIKDLDQEVLNLSSIQKDVRKKLTKVKALIKNNESLETARIAQPLDKFYRKVTRNTTIQKIKLNGGKAQGKSELEIIDKNGSNVPFANIMSAGQISTLAISIFLSRALLNKDSNLGFYLMDDPIQSMDDLNVLSFVDVLRFQFNESNTNKFMNQLVLATCDNDIEKLVMHKMSSFDIPIREHRFGAPMDSSILVDVKSKKAIKKVDNEDRDE